MKKLSVLSASFVLFSALLSGCGAPAEKTAAASASLPAPALFARKKADHQVLVLLGSDYAGRAGILAPIVEEYGLAVDGGMMLHLQYPESFTIDKKIRLSVLSETAKLPAVTVVVTVGAPEGTVRELNKIRSSRPDMQILSLFSADEVLPVEAVSNLVLDYAQAGELLAEEKTAVLSDTDLSVLLLAAMLAGAEDDASIAPLDRLAVSLDASRRILKQKTAGAGWRFAAYVDTDTNLRSRNHVLLELPAGGAS